MTDVWIHTASEGMEGYFVEVGLPNVLCKTFEFTFNMRNLSTLIKLTITENGFAVLGH